MFRQGLVSSASRASWLRRTAAASPTHHRLLPSLPGQPCPQQQQSMRCNWQYVLQKIKDEETGQYKYEDWNDVVRKFAEPTSHLNEVIESHEAQRFHLKPNQLNRRLKQRRIYRNSARHVDDLIRYIKFTREYDRVTEEVEN